MTSVLSARQSLRFICHQEAFVAHAYPDGPGRWSKGFGTIAIDQDDQCSLSEALAAVREHVRANDTWMSQHIKVPLSQNEWDALSSFLYQNGNKMGGRDIIVGAINDGENWISQLISFDMNSKGEHKSGLARRRTREISLAKNSNYGDILQYGVWSGTPLSLVEMRDFPETEPT